MINSKGYIGKDKSLIANSLLDVFTVGLLVVNFLPQFVAFQSSNLLTLFFGLSWLLLAFTSNPHFFLGGNRYFLISILCYGILVAIPLLTSQMTIVNRYTSLALTTMYFWIYSYNIVLRGFKSNMRIVLFSLIPILYTTVVTIMELQRNPFAARIVKSSVDENIGLAQSGVSGYSLIYAVVVMVISMVPVFIESNRLKISGIKKLAVIVLILVFLILVVLSNFFTALILTFTGLLGVTVLFWNRKILIFLIPVIVFYAVVHKEANLLFIDTLLTWVQPEGMTHLRLSEIKTEMLTGVEAESIDSRSDRIEHSLEMLAEYPILGYVSGSGPLFDLQRIGQHSTVLDTFAMYGIFIGSFFLWIMWLPFKYAISSSKTPKMKYFSGIVGFVFIALMITNNLAPTMGFAAFIFFPTIFDYLNNIPYERG